MFHGTWYHLLCRLRRFHAEATSLASTETGTRVTGYVFNPRCQRLTAMMRLKICQRHPCGGMQCQIFCWNVEVWGRLPFFSSSVWLSFHLHWGKPRTDARLYDSFQADFNSPSRHQIGYSHPFNLPNFASSALPDYMSRDSETGNIVVNGYAIGAVQGLPAFQQMVQSVGMRHCQQSPISKRIKSRSGVVAGGARFFTWRHDT